jgi:ribosomal protein L15
VFDFSISLSHTFTWILNQLQVFKLIRVYYSVFTLLKPISPVFATMAAAVFRATLGRIGFTVAARNILSSPDGEDLNFDSLSIFDDDAVKTLCQSLRKPGGTIPGPLPPDAPAGAAPPMIPNPGVPVSAVAEGNLKVLAYILRHYQRTARTFNPATIDEGGATIRRYTQFKKAEKEHKEPDQAMKLEKVDKTWDFIDEWPEHLSLYNGQDGRPLDYIIRDTVQVIPENGDPTFGNPDCTYGSMRAEITARSTHLAPHYQLDNARVFELLKDAIKEHKHVIAWIKPHSAAKDGRGAWVTFRSHYRGSSEVEAVIIQAENRLEKLIYKGEKPRYTFETHVSFHRRSHNEIELARGQSLTDAEKVRKLLTSIQASYLQVAIATIRANDNLRLDFDASVNFLRAFIANSSTQSENEVRNVSQVNVSKPGRGGRGRGGGQGRGHKGGRGHDKGTQGQGKGVDRWYTYKEWRELDEDKRKQVTESRKKRKISSTTTDDAMDIDEAETSTTTRTDPSGGPTQRKVTFQNGTKKQKS